MSEPLYPERCPECPELIRENYGAVREYRCDECERLAHYGLGTTLEGEIVWLV